ncbi:ATP-binding cassette domain-containing protein [Cohnella endophytica]|uniref:ATP-binding cassette domain-containing protein n=1 Tax=Cohnella endophytica TaxID=2419778 RepID=A0A494Y3K5_9BACL|nr:ATP-binding cassette domain-containing protein [Cohnella endophytica]RKP56891.1 ATP-binding cassette domain-containing protein [Cohnella endophytica]
MIVISGLTRTIPDGKTILNNVNTRLEPGTFISVVGSSGSGKSALLKALALKEIWTSGEYRVDGKDLMKEGFLAKMRFRRQIAFLEQKPLLFEKKSALKNVLTGSSEQMPLWRRLTGRVRSDDHMGAMEMLEQVGLMERADQQVEKMSGGERQRIAIARSLVHGAKLVLADEPVSGLDPHSAEEMMRTLKKLCHEKGTTIVAALHRVELAEKFADEIWGMQDGRLILNIKGRRLTAAEKSGLT